MGDVMPIREIMPFEYDTFYLGSIQIQAKLNRIVCEDQTHQVEPKIMEVLLYLVSHQGEVVKREAIMDQVWPDVFVNEITLTRAISELRKILNDRAGDPRFIETIRKVGYRFIYPVTASLPQNTEDSTERAESNLLKMPLQGKPRPKWSLIAVAGFALVAVGVLMGGWFWSSTKVSPTTPAIKISGEAALTRTVEHEFSPSVSPDGQSMLYIQKNSRGMSRIFLKDLKGGPVRPITPEDGSYLYPTWHFEGSRFACLKEIATPGRAEIHIFDLISGSDERIETPMITTKGTLTWSPDGNLLAFSSYDYEKNSGGIFVYDLSLGQTRQISAGTSPFFVDYQAEWSPDGQKLSFIRPLGQKDKLLMVHSLKTGETRELYRASFCSHSWLDQNKIVFDKWENNQEAFGNRHSEMSLFALDTGTGHVDEFGESVGHICQARYHHELNDLFYTVLQLEPPRLNLAHYNSDGSVQVQNAPFNSLVFDQFAHYCEANQKLVFISRRSGLPQIWTSSLDGHDLHALEEIQESPETPIWSPNGQMIAFLSSIPDTNMKKLYVYNVDSKKTKQYEVPVSYLYPPTWSNDSSSLYVGVGGAGLTGVYRVALNGSVDKVHDMAIQIHEAKDGEGFYFVKHHSLDLWFQDAAGEERVIVSNLEQHDKILFQVREEGVYFVTRNDKNDLVNCYDPQLESTHVVASLPSNSFGIHGLFPLNIVPEKGLLIFDQKLRIQSDIFRSHVTING